MYSRKRYRRRLGLSELLAECEKVSASLRENELDADFNSRSKTPVTYIPNLPMLKTAAESYTRRMYSEFEEEFKEQFSFSWKLVQIDGSILTYEVAHMHSNHGATVEFSTVDMTITCSCRKFECIGMYVHTFISNYLLFLIYILWVYVIDYLSCKYIVQACLKSLKCK